MEVINRARSEVRKFVMNKPDLLWIMPFGLSVLYSSRAILEVQNNHKKGLFDAGMAVVSMISTANGLKLANNIEMHKKENERMLEELNSGNELAKRISAAIEQARAQGKIG